MPIRWRPSKPIRTFIDEHDYTYFKDRNRYCERRVFNDKGRFSDQIPKDNEREIYDVEGTLEVQRQLLSKLAAVENQVTGESENSVHRRRIEALKADTVQALQKTWNQSNFTDQGRLWLRLENNLNYDSCTESATCLLSISTITKEVKVEESGTAKLSLTQRQRRAQLSNACDHCHRLKCSAIVSCVVALRVISSKQLARKFCCLCQPEPQ
ncbi:hypothetical protein J3E74DRAFT_286427 [Bipolaris maydis]|nr:hypothetical protein J3E74DRAFT_296405 [Bipolaris maydis]KAJ5066017.1 hypothetical protein J3E74DRAFT_286427 [Bipolaris maydis]